MGQNDFWLQLNNGNKIDFNNLKCGLDKRSVDKKFHSLFDVLDSDKNMVLTADEAGLFYNLTALMAGEDKKLSKAEEKALFKFLGVEIQGDVNLSEFIQSFDKIKDSKEGYYQDGTRILKVTYENDIIETLIFYPDGEIKARETCVPRTQTRAREFMDGKKYSITKIYSERAKKELQEQSMDWILDHVNENLKIISDFQKEEGFLEKSAEAILDIFGKSLSDVQKDLFDQKYFAREADLTRYNKELGGSFTPAKYEKFLETANRRTSKWAISA